MIYPKQSGTYCFHNTVNNKVYVGSAQCLYTRIKNHHKSESSNELLQQAIKKYGLKAFNIIYVTTETHAEAKMQEQLMLDYLFGNNIPRYNLADKVGGGCVGSKENHRKLSLKGQTKEEHRKLCEAGGACKAKVQYALETNNPGVVHTFKSSCEAAEFTEVPRGRIQHGCKKAKPYNGSGRWLFSGVSEEDLIRKFNNLTIAEIKGVDNSRDKTRGFILINKITQEQSRIFYGVYEPQKLGYKVNPGHLSQCLLGNRRTVGGYYVAIGI